jgi:hypothetical protein
MLRAYSGGLRLTILNAKRAFGMIETHISRYLQLETRKYTFSLQSARTVVQEDTIEMFDTSQPCGNKQAILRTICVRPAYSTSSISSFSMHDTPHTLLSSRRIEKDDVDSFRKAQERSLHG